MKMSEKEQWGWACNPCKLAWERGAEHGSTCPNCGGEGGPAYYVSDEELRDSKVKETQK